VSSVAVVLFRTGHSQEQDEAIEKSIDVLPAYHTRPKELPHHFPLYFVQFLLSRCGPPLFLLTKGFSPPTLLFREKRKKKITSKLQFTIPIEPRQAQA
jgi:hypothetical protein